MQRNSDITHFIALPCSDAIETVTMLQQAMLQRDPGLKPLCEACPPARSHISLLMLDLPTSEMVQSECGTKLIIVAAS